MIVTGISHAPVRLMERTNLPSAELIHLARLALFEYGATRLITSLAPGWEQALAHAALELEIPFIAAIPFRGRDQDWTKEERVHYYKLIGKAERVHCLSEQYHVLASLDGHCWQVDRAEVLIALWDYDFQGETYDTMQYATRSGKRVFNLWEQWSHLREIRKALRVRTASAPTPKSGARVYEIKNNDQ